MFNTIGTFVIRDTVFYLPRQFYMVTINQRAGGLQFPRDGPRSSIVGTDCDRDGLIANERPVGAVQNTPTQSLGSPHLYTLCKVRRDAFHFSRVQHA